MDSDYKYFLIISSLIVITLIMFTLFSSIVIVGERCFIPWEPPKKTYYHIFPAGGYKIISGFKKSRKRLLFFSL